MAKTLGWVQPWMKKKQAVFQGVFSCLFIMLYSEINLSPNIYLEPTTGGPLLSDTKWYMRKLNRKLLGFYNPHLKSQNF
jgi:hypothetical protein